MTGSRTATPAEELAQSLRAQGFTDAEARHTANGMYAELTASADGVALLRKRGYDVQMCGSGTVRVYCAMPERWW